MRGDFRTFKEMLGLRGKAVSIIRADGSIRSTVGRFEPIAIYRIQRIRLVDPVSSAVDRQDFAISNGFTSIDRPNVSHDIDAGEDDRIVFANATSRGD
jgi:hypothetical protein